ncbi:MAG: M56 family metallopeptidase [Planctomycetes bacterium]|nr:M56 family metallopeptidase [Planctomycetota bacterium]
MVGAWFVDAAAKAALIFGLAWLVDQALRRASAAVRHGVWFLAFASVLVLPLVSLTLPAWPVAIVEPKKPADATRPDPAASEETRGVTGGASLAPNADRSIAVADAPIAQLESTSTSTSSAEPVDWLSIAWLSGALMALAPWMLGAWRVRQLLQRSRWVSDASWTPRVRDHAEALGLRRPVGVFVADVEIVPMTVGLWRPRIVLPRSAPVWSEERRRAVVLHELVHVRRRDVLVQSMARLAGALHWFDPLAWVGLRRLRVERELASDDDVLLAGVDPAAYAEHLVEIARSVRVARFTSAAALTMAEPSGLERRVRALLDATRSRRRATRRTVIAAAMSTALVVVPLAMVRPVASAMQRTGDEDRLLEEIFAARRVAAQDLHHVHLVATTHWSDWNAASGQWDPTRAMTQVRAWLEGAPGGRWRVDYDPQICKGTYSEDRYLESWDGSRFVLIRCGYYGAGVSWKEERVPNQHPSLSGVGIDARTRFVPRDWLESLGYRLAPTLFTRMEKDPRELYAHHDLSDRFCFHPEHAFAQRKRLLTTTATRFSERGSEFVRVEYRETENSLETWILDPQKGYGTDRYEWLSSNPRPGTPSIIARYTATRWKALTPNCWFATGWTSEFRQETRGEYEADSVGYFAPENADEIFAAKDVVVGQSREPFVGPSFRDLAAPPR